MNTQAIYRFALDQVEGTGHCSYFVTVNTILRHSHSWLARQYVKFRQCFPLLLIWQPLSNRTQNDQYAFNHSFSKRMSQNEYPNVQRYFRRKTNALIRLHESAD